MPLVTTTEMFQKAYAGGYAIGAFNVNNMEIIQGITEAAQEVNSPLILQVSAGARKYAKPVYLRKLVEAAIEDTGLPMALHLDHGEDFEICKACIDGGFSSVMMMSFSMRTPMPSSSMYNPGSTVMTIPGRSVLVVGVVTSWQSSPRLWLTL